MKLDVQYDPTLTEPELLLRAPAPSPQTDELVRRLKSACVPDSVTVFREGEAVVLPLGDILRFFADGKGVSCQTAGETYTVRQRLYELEEELALTRFARVSHSEIVNLSRVAALDLTLTGTIKMTLAGGTVCWVSRRYVKKLKQVLGL